MNNAKPTTRAAKRASRDYATAIERRDEHLRAFQRNNTRWEAKSAKLYREMIAAQVALEQALKLQGGVA